MNVLVKPIKESVRSHESTLQTLQDMLDNWLQCQATCFYLEPIFSSEISSSRCQRRRSSTASMHLAGHHGCYKRGSGK
jgi:hypothetical protein